jgi:hypothetical protein
MALTAKKVYAILKHQISDMEAKLNSPVRYRGTVATADLLPLNPDIGDMYNIESKSIYGEAGMNVAWNGVVWDTMGAPIDMSLYIKSSELADWVKQQNKPTYTAEEVGALPADTKIPSKTSDLQNDSGFLTKIPDNYLSETDKTLSVSGEAADAKATGDKITELSADISNKLNKNQGSENSGKIAGINESGDIVPMFPVSVDYNEETNCLEFGSDQKMELNKGINLDSTLTKTGYAADAGAVGEITNSLKEDIESIQELDRIYDGVDLSIKFAEEIKKYSDIWQWIKARIEAGNFAGIHVNDYIRWQTTDNKWIESHVAGINTYKRCGDREVPNHIDFISKDLWPTLHVMNPVKYNNGIIPTENLSGDGTKTAFVLTNEMAAVASMTIGGTATTAYTYDADTHTITFAAAPAAGTNNIVVTGTGSEYPWLASDLYLYANSLKGHVAGGTNKTSPVKLVDYTKDGIWSKLPEALKAVIVTKRALIPKRYSISGVLLNANDWGWQDMGKLWIPSEVEVYGYGVWANNALDKGGFIQYPIFNCNMRRVKGLGDGGGRNDWWLISAYAGSTGSFCVVYNHGDAGSNGASNTWAGLPVCFRIS